MFKVPLTIIIFALTILKPSFGLYHEECRSAAINSYIAVKNNCRAFIYCQDEETSFEDSCPEETYFNEELSECIIDEDTICPEEEEESEESKEQENNYFITVESEVLSTIMPTLSSTTKHELNVEPTARPKCKRHINAYYPHSQRCEYYYKCISGFLTISRCNFNYGWDYQKEMCVPLHMVNCYGNSILVSY